MGHCRYFTATFLSNLVDHQHRWRWMGLLEVVTDPLLQYRRSKRSKRVTLLNPIVQNVFHVGTTRIDHDRSVSQRAWTKLHSSLKPTHDQSVGDVLRCSLCNFGICVSFKLKSTCFQVAPNLGVTEPWACVCANHYLTAFTLKQPVV